MAPNAWGTPTAYYTPLRVAARVVYCGTDDHIHELWLTANPGSWQHTGLAQLA